ncbi:hypothetical protein KIN20_035050 [Parelaphostrongylus tenuis]|uniref:Uncharacterized protein n=1 Tax=Parelaphostrongylus tenuis TaxID=148309 RepID=A0AAD5RB74_PARTN|nr:hypothetical protein KIN20_035050 [Parelaphostrongylus tenuis]
MESLVSFECGMEPSFMPCRRTPPITTPHELFKHLKFIILEFPRPETISIHSNVIGMIQKTKTSRILILAMPCERHSRPNEFRKAGLYLTASTAAPFKTKPDTLT